MHKFIAASSFLCAGFMILGMLLNNDIYWFIIDLVVIPLCIVNGILIIKKGTGAS